VSAISSQFFPGYDRPGVQQERLRAPFQEVVSAGSKRDLSKSINPATSRAAVELLLNFFGDNPDRASAKGGHYAWLLCKFFISLE